MSELRDLLDQLRAFSLPLDPKNAEFERLHLRGTGGRFSKQDPTYAPQRAGGFYRDGGDEAHRQLQDSFKDVSVARRKLAYDTHAGRDVTSGLGVPHIRHPLARGLHGENLERAFHSLVENGGTSGFTVTYAGRGSKAARVLGQGGGPAVVYPYYYAGSRADGKKNADHVHDLIGHLRAELGHHADLELSRHLGHVRNGGWPLEDHMERVHHPDPAMRRTPEGALGTERSSQAALLVHPGEGKSLDERRQIAQTAAQVIRERARATGHLWAVPDLRLIGTPPPESERDQWIMRPQFTVASPGGIYTMLHQGTSPEVERDLLRGLRGFSRNVHLPAEWAGILGGLDSEHLTAARAALHDGVHAQ